MHSGWRRPLKAARFPVVRWFHSETIPVEFVGTSAAAEPRPRILPLVKLHVRTRSVFLSGTRRSWSRDRESAARDADVVAVQSAAPMASPAHQSFSSPSVDRLRCHCTHCDPSCGACSSCIRRVFACSIFCGRSIHLCSRRSTSLELARFIYFCWSSSVRCYGCVLAGVSGAACITCFSGSRFDFPAQHPDRSAAEGWPSRFTGRRKGFCRGMYADRHCGNGRSLPLAWVGFPSVIEAHESQMMATARCLRPL